MAAQFSLLISEPIFGETYHTLDRTEVRIHEICRCCRILTREGDIWAALPCGHGMCAACYLKWCIGLRDDDLNRMCPGCGNCLHDGSREPWHKSPEPTEDEKLLIFQGSKLGVTEDGSLGLVERDIMTVWQRDGYHAATVGDKRRCVDTRWREVVYWVPEFDWHPWPGSYEFYRNHFVLP